MNIAVSDQDIPLTLETILEIQGRLADTDLGLEDFLQRVLEEMAAYASADGAILVLKEDADFVIRSGVGTAGTGTGIRLQKSKSLSQLCIEQGQALISADCATDPRVDYQALSKAGARSAMCVPLTRGREAFGAVMLMSAGVDVFRPQHLQMLRLMAGIMSATFDRLMALDESGRQQRAAEQQFRRAFEIAVHEMALASLKGRFIAVNPAFCALTGYTAQELLATDFQSITYGDDLDSDLDQAGKLLAGEINSYQIEKRYVRKDGRRVWGLLAVSLVRGADGQPLHFVAHIQDLNIPKLIEEAKQRYEDKFRQMVQGVSNFAIYTLDQDGRITSWNAGAKRIKRYEIGDVVGKSFDIFFCPADRAAGEPARILEMARRDGKFEGRGVRVRGDGTLFMAHVVLDAVKGDDDALIGFTKITRDVSEMECAA